MIVPGVQVIATIDVKLDGGLNAADDRQFQQPIERTIDFVRSCTHAINPALSASGLDFRRWCASNWFLLKVRRPGWPGRLAVLVAMWALVGSGLIQILQRRSAIAEVLRRLRRVPCRGCHARSVVPRLLGNRVVSPSSGISQGCNRPPERDDRQLAGGSRLAPAVRALMVQIRSIQCKDVYSGTSARRWSVGQIYFPAERG
mgnify:CR=1 FL=1